MTKAINFGGQAEGLGGSSSGNSSNSPQTDSPGVLENGHIARIRKSAILAARKRLLYAVGGYDPRVIYRCTDRYSSNTTCMRNENEYIAVELQPKNVILAIFRRFNGHKAVGCIHSPATRFIYSARALILASYIR